MQKNIKIFNIPFDWALQIALLVIQPVAVALIIAFGEHDKWETWVFVALLCASFLYFGIMFVYKIYRGKLSCLEIDEDGISFSYLFKKYRISADTLKVEPDADAKDRSKSKLYVKLFDDKDVGTVLMLNENRIRKLTDVAPSPVIEFFVEICETKTLKDSLGTAPERMKPYIQAELDERERAALEAKQQAADRQRAQEKARQRRKNKKRKNRK